jgi:hypothetical protein
MSDLLWVKMPTKWIFDGVMAKKFSAEANISTDIAALKIYMYLCLFAQPIKHEFKTLLPDFLSFDNQPKMKVSEEVFLTAECTYDQLTEGCGLSRALVSRGIKKLVLLKLMKKAGTTRKKLYLMDGEVAKGWCKLPKRKLVELDRKIKPFRALKNRYRHEAEALKLFMYIISVRSNENKYTDVSKEKINEATHINVYEIDGAVKLLQAIGLLEKVENRGYVKGYEYHHGEKYKLARYFVISSDLFTLPRYY